MSKPAQVWISDPAARARDVRDARIKKVTNRADAKARKGMRNK